VLEDDGVRQVVEVEQTAMCLFKTVRTRMIVHQARSLRSHAADSLSPAATLLRADKPGVACAWRALRQEACSPESLALVLLGLQRYHEYVCFRSVTQLAQQSARRRRRRAAGMPVACSAIHCASSAQGAPASRHTRRGVQGPQLAAPAPVAEGNGRCAQDAEPLPGRSVVGVLPALVSGARPSCRARGVTPGAPPLDRAPRY